MMSTVGDGMRPDTALLAWNAFVAHLPREEREASFFELLDVMDAIYTTRGRKPPAWTADARERLRNGDVTLIDGPVRPSPQQ